MIFEFDDFGTNHVISDQCQSHDCRDQLDKLHVLNPAFKCTLFAIPGEMTPELCWWCELNKSWVELAIHGFYHRDNYECEKMSYEEFDQTINALRPIIDRFFVKGFRAPGWQISDDIYKWLLDHGWWVADQGYNDSRRPLGLKAYVNHDGRFHFYDYNKGEPKEGSVDAYHGHTWDVGWNGIYEDYDKVERLVREAKSFKFVSELFA